MAPRPSGSRHLSGCSIRLPGEADARLLPRAMNILSKISHASVRFAYPATAVGAFMFAAPGSAQAAPFTVDSPLTGSFAQTPFR